MKQVFSLLFLLSSFLSFSQTTCPEITFSYDASGNRIQRKLIIINCNPLSQRTNADTTHTTKDTTAQMKAKVFPNPTQDKINIELEETKDVIESTILLFDVSGKKIYSEITALNRLQIDITGLNAGIYSLKIIRGKNQAAYSVLKN